MHFFSQQCKKGEDINCFLNRFHYYHHCRHQETLNLKLCVNTVNGGTPTQLSSFAWYWQFSRPSYNINRGFEWTLNSKDLFHWLSKTLDVDICNIWIGKGEKERNLLIAKCSIEIFKSLPSSSCRFFFVLTLEFVLISLLCLKCSILYLRDNFSEWNFLFDSFSLFTQVFHLMSLELTQLRLISLLHGHPAKRPWWLIWCRWKMNE